MKAWMRIFLLLLFLASALIPQAPAFSDEISPELEARFAPGSDGRSVYLSTSIRIPSSNSNSGSGTPGNSQTVGPLIRRTSAIYTFPTGDCDPTIPSVLPLPVPTGLIQWGLPATGSGRLLFSTLVNRNTGEIIGASVFCEGFPFVNGQSLIQPVPTYAQIWNAVYSEAFEDSSISSGAYIAPASPGLTGLPAIVWAQFPGGQTIERDVAVAGGYRIQATARISEVRIFATSPKGNQKTLARLSPNFSGNIDGGSFEDPAAITKFGTVGQYEISTGIIWTADSATLSGSNIGPISVPLGSIRIEINREYEVRQLRPAITK